MEARIFQISSRPVTEPTGILVNTDLSSKKARMRSLSLASMAATNALTVARLVIWVYPFVLWVLGVRRRRAACDPKDTPKPLPAANRANLRQVCYSPGVKTVVLISGPVSRRHSPSLQIDNWKEHESR